MIPFQINKRNNKLKILAIGIARNFDQALELAKKAGYPVTDYGINQIPRDSYNAIKDRGKIPIITARDELPEGPELDLLIKELKRIRKNLKRFRSQGGCSVEELAAHYEQIGKIVHDSMPDHTTSDIDITAVRITEARAIFNMLVWQSPDQRKPEHAARLMLLVELINGEHDYGHTSSDEKHEVSCQ